jgi:hypothetical protein
MATTPRRSKKPPAAPPAIGPMLLDLELDEAIVVDSNTTVGEGVKVDVAVNTVTTPSPSVDDST